MYVSDLWGRAVLDPRGETIGRLRDAVARLGGSAPPPLVGLLLRRGRTEVFLPIDAVDNLEPRTIVVSRELPELAPFARRPHEVLLARDVMDSQVIDLRGPRVARANDVVLEGGGNRWRVSGVDLGAGVLVRRLLPRRLRRAPDSAHVLPWADLELLASEVPGGGVVPDHRRLARFHPADIARVADAVPVRQATEIVASLDDELAADTMEEMIDAKQADVVEELEPERAADILERMAPDAAADVLAEMQPDIVDTVLERMIPEEAADVHALLTYSKHTAGGLMSPDYVIVPRGLLVRDAAAYLRPQMETLDWVYYMYVVEDERERRLVGVFSLRRLFLAQMTQRVDEIMDPASRRVAATTPATTVAQIMSEYNLLALPVTDGEGRMLGIVSVDDALEVMLPAELRRRVPRIFS